MQNDELLAIVAALILPAVQKDMGKDATDLLDVIEESVSYAADILENVKEHMEEPGDDDDGEKVEVIPPRRRHA